IGFPAPLGAGAATVVVTPAVLALMGFTATGIAAGSFAAWLMSFFAQYYGGGIISGTIVAILQSFGTGLTWWGSLLTAVPGGVLGHALSTFCNQTIENVEFIFKN
uniref:Uncharacterized protein n=1 Tax=Kryptolebias marmoratus TaxID=37003 RepID=A0A3Q3B682_KRYMA